jgi:Protein of unknown function (DUF1524)
MSRTPESSHGDFEAKKSRLSESHLELIRYFRTIGTWRRDDIEGRAAQLAEAALSIWPDFGDGGSQQVVSGRVTNTVPRRLHFLGRTIAATGSGSARRTSLGRMARKSRTPPRRS